MASSPSREGRGLAALLLELLIYIAVSFYYRFGPSWNSYLVPFFFTVAFEIGDMGELTHPLSED